MTTPSPRRLLRALIDLGVALLQVALSWLAMSFGIIALVINGRRLLNGPPQLSALLPSLLAVLATAGLAVLVARPLAAASRRRVSRASARKLRWLQASSLAWLAVTLTVRTVVAIMIMLVSIIGLVALCAPWLVSGGDRVNIGPWLITTMPGAVLACVLAVVLFGASLSALPWLTEADRWLARRLLIGDEERLREQLSETSTSRARIVNAFDVERRRIERDLHDGVQPELLGVSLTLGLALASMPAEDPNRPMVEKAQQQSLAVLESLRRFVHGIHPQVLDDHGLGAAITELAATLPMPVTVDDQLERRLPAELEASLYYACAELVSNVAKHSSAEQTSISVRRAGGQAQLTVVDDGRGGADPNGGGLTGVRDRIAAIGGDLVLDSPAGGPTQATVSVPLQEVE